MNLKFYLIIAVLLFAQVSFACEFGVTYKDVYGKPETMELSDFDDNNKYAYYFPEGKWWPGHSWKMIQFINDTIFIQTEYSYNWYEKLSQDEMPYVLYKSHRWYPQHHGIIYVYKDGHEVK